MSKNLDNFFYDYSNELEEYISRGVFQIRNKNPHYKKLLKQVEDILDQYPKLRKIIEDFEVHEISIEECKAMVEIQSLQQDINTIQEKEIFFLGGRELYHYLKKIEVLK